ncbi:MAG: GNAT family N-acetyltransferase [Alphaproteobacteria bacterium]|nr:GNAT family N-acetyltransferase [Alphaproteobacteria bacterium]
MISYRPAVPEDAALVADLFERAFVETFGHLYKPADLQAFLNKLSPAAFRKEIEDPAYRFLLALDGNEAAGFCKIGPLTLPVDSQGALELRQLYLLRRWYGGGIAPVLMDWALGEARRRGVRTLYLSVYSDNHRAKAFYRRYGFAYVAPYAFMVGEQADEDEIWKLELA